MHFLITGGSGFLGIHLIKKLLKDKHRITILDLAVLPEKNLLTKLTFIQGDVRNSHDVQKAMAGVDIVIHAAAALPLESPHNITTTTVDGTKLILQTALKQNVKRVIYICSTTVYGIPKKHPILETDPLVGVGPYGHAKIAAEQLCEQYRQKGLIVPIVRPKTFIGTERLGVFQILCNWVRGGRRIPVIGSGHNRYQLLEVTDLVEAIVLLAKKPPLHANHAFNVGAEHFDTVHGDVTALCQFAKSGSTVMPVPSWLVKPILRILEAVNLSPLYRWIYDTADKDSFVSIDKLKALGWQPQFSNAQALIHMYEWYLKHYQQIESQSGTTHRVGWNQGALGLLKKFL